MTSKCFQITSALISRRLASSLLTASSELRPYEVLTPYFLQSTGQNL
jgi:hypothetical protein